jgi:outer membrane protein assembly factor BamB
VYIINDGKLYALEADTGHEQWSFKVGKDARIENIMHSIIYATEGKTLKAISIPTGKELWSFNSKSPISSKLIFYNGMIYFTTGTVTYFGIDKKDQGYLYAIDGVTGKI